MLDQNTDRMWYVIGAVLVGAAIILIANGTIPEIFASITGSFDEVANVASTAVVGIDDPSNALDYELGVDVTYSGGTYYYTREGHDARQKHVNSTSAKFHAFLFPRNTGSNSNVNVTFNNVFDEPGVPYEFKMVADRIGYIDIEYEVYYGDTLAGTFHIGVGANQYENVSIIASAPEDLDNNNNITIRSRYYKGANVFWFHSPSVKKVNE